MANRLLAWPRRLIARIYLFGIIFFILFAIGLLAIGRYMSESKTPFTQLALCIISTLAEKWDDPEMLNKEAIRIKDNVNARFVLYDCSGNILYTSFTQPPPPLKQEGKVRLERIRSFTYGFPPINAVGVIENGGLIGYGLVGVPKPPFILLRNVMGLILVIVTIFSILFARSLAVPIARLSKTANDFGMGNFDARTGIHRKDELGYLAKTFDEMADRVNHLLRSQKELLANISHELRTPLSRIRVALDIAAEGNDGVMREQFANILEDLAELEQLVKDVLTAARLDINAEQEDKAVLPLRLEAVDVKPLLDKIAKRFSVAYSSHRLEIIIDKEVSTITVDLTLLRRVIDNLIDNARKYSRPGSVISIRARDDGQKMTIEVIDQGIGIDEADIENVFKPFFRTDRSRTRSTGGVGLGLTLSRQIVEAHGGSIVIRSVLGEGTTVRFTMPHCPIPNQTAVS